MSQLPADPKPQVTLSPEDAAVLDALLLGVPPSGGSLSIDDRLKAELQTPADAARTQRVQSWLNVLAAAPVPAPSSNLLDRTLAAVQSDRMKLDPARPPVNASTRPFVNSPFRRHLGDIAAMLIAGAILVAVIIPVVGHVRYDNRRVLCAANVSNLANAFDHYAIDNGNQLPSLACPAGANWLDPDPATGGHTNLANLLPLVLAHGAPAYIPPKSLICPGRGRPENAATASSDIPADYSYANLFGTFPAKWDGKKSTIILADRNPLFSERPVTNPDFNSINHERHGNYVLRADHSVTWEISPNIGPAKDNIWTIAANPSGSQRVLFYTGTETPATPNDAFLAP